ncbi:MAG: PPC domain-containing protein [Spirochaetes bacterium]|nr:PPC domain-containing protein [Spirochaetota bacterium]
MKTRLLFIAVMASISLVYLSAQRPHVGYMYPAGVQKGGTATVTIGGMQLEDATNVIFDGKLIPGNVLSLTRDLDKKELNGLNRKREYLEGKIPKTTGAEKTALEKQLARVMAYLATREKMPEEHDMKMYMKDIEAKKQPNAQLKDMLHLEVSIPADAAAGRHELRLGGSEGVSEPLVFYVGAYSEVMEKEPNDDNADAVPLPAFPVVINGQILPGEVDRFHFKAVKGQKLVFTVLARALMPYLADAVPGWFQSVLTVYDKKGKEIAFADDFYINPDPVLAVVIPADGDYYLEIRDSIYRGRDDFVYRITAGEIPLVTGMFPLGGQLNNATTVLLSGYNLTKKEIALTPAAALPGIVTMQLADDVALNAVLFHADDLPEITAVTNAPGTPVPVKTPVIINGRINKPGEIDLYTFTAKANDRIAAEVFARRLGSPLDAGLRLTDAKGALVMSNDDYMDASSGLTTHHADSYFVTQIPADGVYTIALRDMQNKSGDLFAYRLRLSAPRPDFKLRMTPSSVALPLGGSVKVDVFLQRIDGFAGDVTLTLDKSTGLNMDSAVFSGTNTSMKVTLKSDVFARARQCQLLMSAQAVIDGKTVVRTVQPAEDMMQAFAYRHLVPADECIVTIGAKKAAGAKDGGPGKKK